MDCRHIGFHFNKLKILEDFNLRLQAGDFLGIQGDSGKGKTTLLNIIIGFIDPEQGEVLINGTPNARSDRKKYWHRIAYVKQQPFIIHDTLLTNITLLEEGYDEDRLQFALSVSGLDEIIEQLPGGLQAKITENGKNISGGQRQRISLARALYKNADLIILDEPFSELDEASEERLLHRFRLLAAEGKIVVMITHNKQSLSWCNKTLSLDPSTTGSRSEPA